MVKMPKLLSISKESKQTLLGGIVGALAVNLESGLSWFVAAYPQPLKDKLNPSLPRNGALVADLAPVGVAYAMTRKGRGSARRKNMAQGIYLYSLPKLVDELVYNAAYQAGIPATTAGLRLSYSPPMPPIRNMRAGATIASGTSRYAVMGSTPTGVAGVGRYRAL